jgi:hypothetical protein
MSIFDRRRSAPDPDIDIELEQPRYQQPEARPQAQPQPQRQQVQPQPEPKPAAPAQAPRPAAQPASATPAYGIQKAIELMRSLPSDNIPLIVQVVRTTLESTNVDVASIIDDAKAKRARIVARIEGLRREISNFEEEIAARREEIVALDADHAETKLVQDRLEMSIRPREESKPATPVTVSLGGEASRPGAPRPAVAEPGKPTNVRPPATG